MKSVTAFVGSARKNGVTHRATRRFLDDLESFGDVRSELVFLSDYDIGLCRGCKACLFDRIAAHGSKPRACRSSGTCERR
jgi:multimeric flavodoxin WrbA